MSEKCVHRWAHLSTHYAFGAGEATEESSGVKYMRDDIFFCENCLTYRVKHTVESKKTPYWYK